MMEMETEETRIVFPHGGYQKLIAFKKSDVIFEGTSMFCSRFFPLYGNRTVDQMVQAARSCKQNIAEGSAASGTSKETEVRLSNVARASLDELIQDYLDWLKSHNQAIWPPNDRKTIYARYFGAKHPYWDFWKPIFETRPSDTLANLILTFCYQTRYLLDKLIGRQDHDLQVYGGFRERIYAVRSANRADQWKRNLYSFLNTANSPIELDQKAGELHDAISQVVLSIKKRKYWL